MTLKKKCVAAKATREGYSCTSLASVPASTASFCIPAKKGYTIYKTANAVYPGYFRVQYQYLRPVPFSLWERFKMAVIGLIGRRLF